MNLRSVDQAIPQRTALTMMAACAVLWSTSGALIKLVDWNGLAIAGVRSVIAGVFLYGFLRFVGQKLVLNKMTLLAAFAILAKYVCFTVGNKMTSSANMVALQYTSPVFVLLFSMLFLGQRFKGKDLAVSIAALCGIAMLTLESQGASSMFGNALGLLVGITTAIMHLVSSKAKTFAETMSINIVGNIYTAIVCLPFCMSLSFTPSNITGILLLGVLQQGVSYALYSYAIRNAPTLQCTLITALNPLCSPIWSALLVKEYPGPLTLIGFGIVLGSITIWTLSNAKDKTKQEHLKKEA